MNILNYPICTNFCILFCIVCDRFKTANISRNIAPSGDLRYRPGDDVILNCSFYPVQKVGQRPFWFFVNYDEDGNVTIEYVRSNNNTRQEFHYDKKKCIWRNTLTIFNFSEELSGTYSCGYSYHIINQTLRLLEEGRCTFHILFYHAGVFMLWGILGMGYIGSDIIS